MYELKGINPELQLKTSRTNIGHFLNIKRKSNILIFYLKKDLFIYGMK